ncbi:phosphotransferase system, enzyme I, PtsI [Candidatus Thermokryptus mobilis]|uniref:Phosphoenolpyruvate-protein phosphotransferase n=1 Tax=Candidatus Thermokryptus mobilis TaxID=1643428 RepID=A0A0S4ND86_9BACT|nr:phosphoenolpyruvate--protein phosphotransferase [Candidatus Thermokryptus mobilis]CUU09056.1 phosphotransferase system, enzyme I, PtsI [Candidatus Thermokryptus mobilis]
MVKGKVIEGIPASPGIAIGVALKYEKLKPKILKKELKEEEVSGEIEKFLMAIERSKSELRKILTLAVEKLGSKGAEIFEAQILMLDDKTIIDKIIERIKGEKLNAEFIIQDEIEKYIKFMQGSGDDYLKERAHDLEDLKNRVIRNIQQQKWLSRFDTSRIVVAENLTPADTILFSRNQVLGYATDLGGMTSHTAILARALKIPAVVGLKEATKSIKTGDLVILDGYKGILIINPEQDVVEEYQNKIKRIAEFERKLEDFKFVPAVTIDGRKVTILANIEFPEEVNEALESGAEGVGLFRTEYIISNGTIPEEDEQFEEYFKVAEKVYPYKVVIRTFDVGGDKIFRDYHREDNPFLGWRGIRIGLDKPEILLSQLRAILRASVKKNVWVMFPMVSSIDEVREVKKYIDLAKAQLKEKNIPFDENIKVGVMIETPSSALMAKEIAREVDFFSIGTNDLIQYTLAVDRGNETVAKIFQEFHPAVLRLIQFVVESAQRAKIPVSVCGEMAADPYATVLLVGFGLDELSVTPKMIPEIKRIIKTIKFKDAKRISKRALVFKTQDEVKNFLMKELKGIIPEIEI